MKSYRARRERHPPIQLCTRSAHYTHKGTDINITCGELTKDFGAFHSGSLAAHHIRLFRSCRTNAYLGRSAIRRIPHAAGGIGARIPGAAILVPVIEVQVRDGTGGDRGEVHLSVLLFLVRFHTESVGCRCLQAIEFRTEGGCSIVITHGSAVVGPIGITDLLPLEAETGRTSFRVPAAVQDGKFRPRLHRGGIGLHRRGHGQDHRSGAVTVAHVNQIHGEVIVAHGQSAQEGAKVHRRFRCAIAKGRYTQPQAVQGLNGGGRGIHQLHQLRQAGVQEFGVTVAQRQGLDAPGRTEMHHIMAAAVALLHGNPIGQVKVLPADGRKTLTGEIQVQLIVLLVQGIVDQHPQEACAALGLGPGLLINGELEMIMLSGLHVFNRHRPHLVSGTLRILHIQDPIQCRSFQISAFANFFIALAEHQGVGFIGNGYTVIGEKFTDGSVKLGGNHGAGQFGGESQFVSPVRLDVGYTFRLVAGRFPTQACLRAGNSLDSIVPHRKCQRLVYQSPIIGHLGGFSTSRGCYFQGEGRIGLTGLIGIGLHHRGHRQVGSQPYGEVALPLRQVRFARAGHECQQRSKAISCFHKSTPHRIQWSSPSFGSCCRLLSG